MTSAAGGHPPPGLQRPAPAPARRRAGSPASGTQPPAALARAGRYLRRAAALYTLAAFTFAVPVGLVHYAGWPLPGHVPAWAQVRAAMTVPLTQTVMVKVLACGVWLAWLLFALCLAAETVSVLSGVPAPRLPGLAPAQALVSALTGALAITAATLPVHPVPPPAAVSPAPHADARPARLAVLPRGAFRVRGPLPGARLPRHRPGADGAAGGAGRRIYRVAAGDTLWDIAYRYLGDPEAWREIFTLNRGRPQPGGRSLTDPALIYPGWLLLLPAQSGVPARHAAPPRHQAPPPAAGHTHTGRHRRTPRPSPAGPAGEGTGAPAPHPGGPAATRGGPPGIALPGGGLAGITLATAIGTALVAWRVQRARAARPRWPIPQPRSEPPLPPSIRALRRAHLRSLAEHGEPGGAWRAADHSGTDGGGGLDEPGAPTGPAPGQPPSASPGAGQPGADSDPGRRPAAAGRGSASRLTAPAPLPAGDAGSRPAAPGRPLAEGTVVFGTRGATEIPLDAVARPGISLTGPGAQAAARALLIGVLAAPPSAGRPAAQVIIPAADARDLFGDHPEQAVTIPDVTPGLPAGLIITPGLASALDRAETAITSRLRQLEDADASPGTSGARAAGAGTPGPLALIATVDPPSAARVQAVLGAGAGAGITGILLGGQAPGPACHLGADGTVLAATDPALPGVQASHLTAADTAAMLSLLRGAQGHLVRDEPAPPQPPARAADHATGTAPGRAAQPGTRPGSGPAGTSGAAEAADAARPRPASQPDPLHRHQDRGQAQAVSPPAAPAAGPGRPVMVSVLGPVQITAGGREVSGGLRKARELVAYLVVHPQGVTGEGISADLWPESAPRYAASQRKLTLRKAREMLRAATGLPAPLFITRAGDRYRLDPALIGVDLWQFDAALARAQAAASEEDQLTALRQAAALYQGPLAEGGGYEWAEQHAEPARRRAVDALARIAAILRPGHPEEALAVLETALAHDPYNEALYQEIMGIQARLGRPGAARRTLALLQTRLAALGLSPAPASRQAAGIPPAGRRRPPGRDRRAPC